MDTSTTDIGGLPLPAALLRAIGNGAWKPPQDAEVIRNVFGDEPDWTQFYDLPTIVRQNQFFQSKSQAEVEGEVPGSGDGMGISPPFAVLIGSLGADMPIALDYRLSRIVPRVIYLGAEGWREIAPNFEGLLTRLGL
jgi:hypothetical protein